MSVQTDEIEDILASEEYFPESLPVLFEVVRGVREPDTLSYEQWVNPLRMTGGKIALKWSHEEFDHYGYVWWEPQGLVYTFETTGERYQAHSAVVCFKETMEIEKETIEVVLKEDIDA